MLVISEDTARRLVSLEAAIGAVAASFAASDRGETVDFPVVRDRLGTADAVFGAKTAYDRAHGILGLKAGGYWPHNSVSDVPNHQSTTFLFDPHSGRPVAAVSANYLTAVRTAAASAIATDRLARRSASTLAIVGTGTQALYQLHAIRLVRPITRVLAWNRDATRLAGFLAIARERGVAAEAASIEDALAGADIVVTATPSTAALVPAGLVRPGTHINAVGADTVGKQEFEPALVAKAVVYADSIEQSVTIGECQHAYRLGLVTRDGFAGTLGALASGRLSGRLNETDITLFDSTGVALQDLAVAALAHRALI